MTRTTLDIDPSVLRELKRRQKREGKSLGELVSELLAEVLAAQRPSESQPLRWPSRGMRPKIDLEDKETMMRLTPDVTVRSAEARIKPFLEN